jgi:hypothetical protein
MEVRVMPESFCEFFDWCCRELVEEADKDGQTARQIGKMKLPELVKMIENKWDEYCFDLVPPAAAAWSVQ